MNQVIRFHDEKTTKIWERLHLGCFYDAVAIKFDNPLEITATLNCTPEAIHYDNKIKTHRIPNWHDGFAIKEVDFWEAQKFLREQLWNGGKVLVHCHAGMSRSPSMVAAYLHLCGFEDFEKALFNYVKLLRPIIEPNIEVTSSIKKHLKIWPYCEGAFDGTEYNRTTERL